MAIHQLLAAAAPGDAVTNTALAYRRRLRTLGPSEVFAAHVHDDLVGEVHRLRTGALADAGPDDVLLVHVSIGAPEVVGFLEGRGERVGLVYHNLSPAPAFAPYEPGLAALLALGRRQLPALAARCDFALACSAYNAAELDALGVRRLAVVPPVSDLDGLLAASPGGGRAAWFDELEGPVVLLVAQVAPHKRQHALVNAFHVLSTWLHPAAHLVLVGPTHTPVYAGVVRRHADRLALLRAHLFGRGSLGELAAAYRRADVFATLSEHEGYCLPLVEAMAFDVPVVAVRAAAVPETAGDAAVLLDDPAPALVAEALATVLEAQPLRAELAQRGRLRVEAYRSEARPERFLEALGRFL